LVDLPERRSVRRAVPRDVDQLALARHVRLEVPPGTAAKIRDAGAVHADGVEVDPRDLQLGDRVSLVALEAESACLTANVLDPRLWLRLRIGGLVRRGPPYRLARFQPPAARRPRVALFRR